MKNILIMRHAKSDWHSDATQDHERPLNERGRSASRIMGSFVSQIHQVPHAVLVSSAVRARTTIDIAVAAGKWESRVITAPELYSQSLETILELVRGQDDSTDSLMLAGHEPTSSSLLAASVGGGSYRFPTAAIARIDFPVEAWERIRFGIGDLRWFVTPKIVQRGLLSERNKA
jgi:phosphohistidine phosphatase